MDRDELEWRFAVSGAADDENKRKSIIKNYVKERTGVEITDDSAGDFDPYLSKFNDSALALRARGSDFDTFTMCAVFPPNPNGNQRLEIERVLQLVNAHDAYGAFGYDQLKEKMTYDDLVLFSILHESGHCLDSTFAQLAMGEIEDPHAIHRSESFAETVGVLLMAKEGHTNIAKARAALRTIYSYYLEPFFLKHPEFGFGSESIKYGGIVYYLAPVILAADAQVSADPKKIQSMSIADILALAKDIVLKNDYDSRTFQAIYSYYSEGRDKTLARYKDWAENESDFFAQTYAQLKDYIALEDRTKASYFDPNLKPPVIHEGPLAPINYDELCADYKKKDFEAFESKLDKLRDDLKAGNHGIENERVRAKTLMGLLSELPKKCE
jgi:hypothetical protein